MQKLFTAILTGALLLLSTPSHSQVFLHAGYLGSSETSIYPNGNKYIDKLNGFCVGAGYNYNLVKGLGIASGLFGTYLAGKDSGTVGSAMLNATETVRFVEFDLNIPIYATYGVEIGDLTVFAYAGPAFQLGLLCHSTDMVNGNFGLVQYSSSQPYVYDHYKGDDKHDRDQNPFNVYLSVGAGVQLGTAIQLIFGYEHNLSNMTSYAGYTQNRSQFHIGLGVALGSHER
ncbi:MAG: outer membrane beta-barrel protein [Bacteroidales bacterium]|nr:outer membrane beta-barrel protein [Bacteroidales bacterium]